jgi:hypothetical protein
MGFYSEMILENPSTQKIISVVIVLIGTVLHQLNQNEVPFRWYGIMWGILQQPHLPQQCLPLIGWQ